MGESELVLPGIPEYGRKERKGEGRRPCRQIAHFLLEAQAEVN